MRVLRASDYRSMPWKNGGGVTTEIIVSPAGAGLDAFDWRVSMARIDSGGPFSVFPGVDRTLAILQGDGILLHVAGRLPIGLTGASDPLPFPADLPARADLFGAPITDLNVMTRRGRVAHSFDRLLIKDPIELVPSGWATLIFCHLGEVDISSAETIRIGPLDTACLGGDEPAIRLEPVSSAALFVIRIHPVEEDR